MAGAGLLEELELSAEEVERLQRAFRDEKFRALFAEYTAELADPEQRRLYEEEVTALERERGMEVRFIHPEAGYVLRTSQAGSRRCYLNVCSNPHVGAPQARAEDGGHRWALPYSLAPGREELSRGGQRRLVYDVVFHPAALRLAARKARFRRLLSDTALDAVERHCSVELDRANAVVLRGTKYKGVPQAPVIRTPLPGGAPPQPDDGDSPLPHFPFPPAAAAAPPPAAPPPPARPPGPTTPRWSIRHRSYVDLQNYRYSRDSAPSPVPRELVVTVELPLLRSAAQADLNICGRELRLDSQRPAYRLRLRLPYDVDESRGSAAFNKAQRQLVVTLPVVPQPGPREPLGLGGERVEKAEPSAEAGGGAASTPGGSGGTGGTGGTVQSMCDGGEAADPPAGGDLSPPRSGAASPALCSSPEQAVTCGLDEDASLCLPGNPALLTVKGIPSEMALPRDSGSPEAALCPPFQCRQDETSLTLLVHVPYIKPQSLSEDVGTNHYSLHFSSETGSYALFLQFPPENKLASTETSVNVSAHNAAFVLTKAPDSTGLWEKFSFGLEASTLQERWFVSEENIDGFLGTVSCPSFCFQSAPESQPLIEVLDVTEDRIQIRLTPQETVHSECDGKEEMHSSSGGELDEKTNGDYPQTKAETNCTAADTVEGERAAETNKISTSFAETIGKVGCSSHHCLQHEPSDTSSAIPGESRRKEPDLESAAIADERAVAASSEKQAGLLREEQAGGEGDEVAAPAGSAQGDQHSSDSRAASPLLREVSTQDGSVQIIRDHVTHCPVTFQNSLLYELD
ncbi:protein kintoun isoform X1 [Pezoporus wallicus]|uniref:protein kintoun n=1 Tax=Pezoporus flaviventris TaxID=889875 RepID=UPI00255155CC|nr:protein kintoun isoform X1 [Pezoporus wallicus]XP_061318445.1 protein kintoun [Pezoporus flaviventris]